MPRGPIRARTTPEGAFARVGFWCALALFATAPSPVARAEPRVEIQMRATPEAAKVGERIRLEIRVDATGGRIDRVELPNLDAFTVLGHRESSPVRFQFGLRSGANVEATEIHQLTLRAERSGSIEIEAPIAFVEGRRYEGAPTRIEVEDDPSGALSSAPSEPEGDTTLEGGAPVEEVFDARAFIRTGVTRDEVFVGEQITYEIELYTRVSGSPRFTKEATTDGFWVQDLLDPSRRPPERREVVRGVPFHVYTIKRVAAFPLRAGDLRIGAPRLEIASSSPFGRGESIVRRGEPIDVRVKPLPKGTPKDALVGRFTLRGNLDRHSLDVGEAATLEVVLEGQGNVRDVDLALPEVDGLRVLAPEIDTTTTVRNGRIHGKREARFLLIAERPGVYVVPPLSVPVFDPERGESSELATSALRLLVRGEAAGDDAGAGAEDGAAPPEEEVDSRSLGSFRGRSELERGAPALAERPIFFVLLAAPPALLGLAALALALARRVRTGRRRRERERRHQRLLNDARARRAAGDAPGLYAALAGAIHAALEELLDEHTRGLTHREIGRRLRERGAPSDLITRTVEELEGLDFARFAAESTQDEEMDRAMGRIGAIIDRLDAMKKGGPA